MAVKAGKIVLDSADVGAGGWDVTGIGFEPTAVLFIFADMTVEDTWVADSTAYIQGGMGVASLFNSVSGGAGSAGTGIENAVAMQLWGNGGVASSALNVSLSQLCKSDHGTFNYGVSIRSFNADGWNMRFANGGTLATDADGKIIYYLAIGGRETAFAFPDSTSGSDAPKTTATTTSFLPKGVVMVGGPFINYVDHAYDSYAAFAFPGPDDFDNAGITLAKAQGRRFIPIGGGDASDWDEYGPTDRAHQFDYDDSGFVPPNTYYEASFVADPTSLETTIEGIGGFSYAATHNRFGQLIIGAADMEAGEFVPNTAVDDTPEPVVTAITPEAFIFMSGPGFQAGSATLYDAPNQTDVDYGQTTIGFLTADFQCVVTWGGVLTGHAAKFQSSQRSWVSNYVNPVPIGDDPTLGEATLTANGFEHVTKQNDAAFVHRVIYWGIGDLAPAFVPQIYRRL